MPSPSEEKKEAPFRVLTLLSSEEERRRVAESERPHGLDLRVVGSGPDLVGELGRQEFELLLLDADVSTFDLRELIAQIRAVTLETPLIFLTSRPSDELLFLSMESGSLDVLRKPLNAALLRRLVTTHRGRLRSGGSLQVETFAVSKSAAYSFPCQVNLLPLVANKVAADIRATGAISAAVMHSLNLAIFECLTNALEHGNLEIGYDKKTELIEGGEYLSRIRTLCAESPHRHRRIHLDYLIDAERIEVGIADEGPGFDFSRLEQALSGPDGEASFHGRGLLLARKMVDRISYDAERRRVVLHIARGSARA